MNVAVPLNIIIIFIFKIQVKYCYTSEYYNNIFAFAYKMCLIFK